MEANEINTTAGKNFGKGPHCTMLTLRKFMSWDAKKLGRSMIFKVKGVTSEPNGKNGLGRRAYLYSLRANADVKHASSAPSVPRKARTAKAKAPVTPSGDVSDSTKKYEEIKAILTQPTPVVVPAVTITTPEVAPATVVPATPVTETASSTVTEVSPEAVPVSTETTAPIAS
jgi:hypothetical protein